MSTGEVKRYSGRTYSRPRETAASQAFDEAFGLKPKATPLRFGNATFSKSRDDQPEPKKARVEENLDDPFSFEFDEDIAPRKSSREASKANRVTQPAVRITTKKSGVTQPAVRYDTWNKDENGSDKAGDGDELVMKKVPVKTYSRGSRKLIKEEPDASQLTMDKFVKSFEKDENEDDFDFFSPPQKEEPTPGPSGLGAVHSSSEEQDDELYIEKDDGSSSHGPTEEVHDEDKNLLFQKPHTRSKRGRYDAFLDPEDGDDPDKPITITFRSKYLDPDVYKTFTPHSPKDPVGRLSNSKVVHKSELKHDGGTTLIVVCSPKVGAGPAPDSQVTDQPKTSQEVVEDKQVSEEQEVVPSAPEIKESTSDLTDVAEEGTTTESAGPDSLQEKEVEKEEEVPAAPKPRWSTRSSRRLAESGKDAPPPEESSNGEADPTEKSVPTETRNTRSNLTKSSGVKYHRIFRSRNKGLSDPKANADGESAPSPSESDGTKEKTPESQPTQPLEESPITISSESQSQNEESGEGMRLPVLINVSESPYEDTDMTSSQELQTDSPAPLEDSSQEVDSSQEIGESSQELSSSQESSQESQSRKNKSGRPPPEERKIFRSRKSATPVVGTNGQKSIFKSPKKSAAVYNVRSWQSDMDEERMRPPPPVLAAAPTAPAPPPPTGPPKLKPMLKRAAPSRSEKDIPHEPPKLVRAVHWPTRTGDEAFTSLHVPKEHKELFTVVRNVKEAHECQEFGETQDFDDDIEYLLAGVKESEPMSTRCLSCIGLAMKCIGPAFRMHLRAHGTVTKIFGSLQDAASDPSLALCTSALMFMLSRDRLNMDLDHDALNLMLRLLGVDQQEDMGTTLSPSATRALNRNRDRVREVYDQFIREGGGKLEIDIDSISTGNLAMESLLSLTSRRAGEWFKEELRSLGALDHIVDTVCSCIEAVGDCVTVLTNSCLENIKKIDRCLRVLENMTFLNTDNQTYLISYKSAFLVSSLCRAVRTCEVCLSVYPLQENVETGKVDKESFGWVIYSCILAILRVLLNLTHDNEYGCTKVGEQDDLIETVLLCILQSPQYVPLDLRFDMLVLSLGLLINLVEHCAVNRRRLITMKTRPSYESEEQDILLPATQSLVQVFGHQEAAARHLEKEDEPTTPESSPNKSGEWRESDSGMEWVIDSAKKDKSKNMNSHNKNSTEDNGGGKDLDDEETFTKALHKAGKHMESSIVAAYVALLLGCLIQDNTAYKEQVKSYLADNSFEPMIYMLKKFLGFMNLTSAIGTTGGKSIARVIEILEAC